MKTFTVAFTVSKGQPRTKKVYLGVRILNAESDEAAIKSVSETLGKKYPSNDGWELGFVAVEVTQDELTSLMAGKLTDPK